MKVFFLKIIVNVAVILSFCSAFAADKKPYPTSPPAQVSKKWRIGYLEGGPYKDYQKTLISTVEGLITLGWIEKISIPEQENNEDTAKLWAWLAVNAKSRYLEFVKDAYYSNNWKKEFREQTRKNILGRLNETRDIDLMLALGTWAGQDMANNDHTVPTVICSVSDAVASKIVKSAGDSGYDHVHARLDPTRYERQIRAFHDVIGFKKLGVAFENSEVGRSYAALGDIERVAKERKFEIAECHFRSDDVSKEDAEAGVIKCAAELAPKIDAFYITVSGGVTSKSLPKILEPMNTHKVPTFSQIGTDEVKQGVLLSVSHQQNFKNVGMFQSQIIAKIINGAKPRDLEQVYEPPVKIAFNKAEGRIIDLRDDIWQFLIKTSDEIYDKIETDR